MSTILSQPVSGVPSRPIGVRGKIGLLHFLLVMTLAFAVVVWGITLISGAKGYELMQFVSLVIFFGVACAFFVISRLGAGFQSLFEAPVYMTCLAFVCFGAAPISSFLDKEMMPGELYGDTSFFYPALQIVIVGMVAFWLGAELAGSRKPAAAAPDKQAFSSTAQSNLTLGLGTAMYSISFAAKVYGLRYGMYTWIGTAEDYTSRLAQAQVLGTIAASGLYGLILFCIEAYFNPKDRVRRGLFWGAFASECFWGLLSGSKGGALSNLLAVALVASFTKRKFQLRWFAPAVLGLVLIIPLIGRYRAISSTLTGNSSNRFALATQAMQTAGSDTVQQERAGSYLQTGWRASVERVNLLGSVALLLAYKDQAYRLEGDERLWMIPFYPFIPRLLWRDKPILNAGARFTLLLSKGAFASTSTALTTPGDLYVRYYGIAGLLLGMLIVGLFAQWMTNVVKVHLTKRSLFLYCCMFFTIANWELDFFDYCVSVIHFFVIIYVLTLALYGPARRPKLITWTRKPSA